MLMKRQSVKEDTKIHILFLIGSLKYGGAERVVSNLSKYFAESGRFRISIRLLEDVIDYPVSEAVDIGVWHSERRTPGQKIGSIIKSARRLEKFVRSNNVDIVLSFMEWSNAVNMLSKAMGAKHKAYVNVRCRVKVHYGKSLGKIAALGGWVAFKWLWRYADKTIVNSKDIKGDISSLFNIKPGLIKVIHNPLNIKEIEECQKEPIDKIFSIKKGPLLINVASLTRPKGHHLLLKAFRDVVSKRSAHLLLIGDGELRKDLVAEVKRLDIEDKITFLGWQSNPYKYIMNSDIFILSSIYEGFPNVLLEAMACGCPVISFNCPSGPREILSPDDNVGEDIKRAKYGVLVKREDESALAKAIEELLDDNDAMSFYRNAGKERSLQFDLPIIAKEFESLFIE